jgi:hypothetical protein
MRDSTVSRTPSLAQELVSLAGLYRNVFWMIGRKAQYGRIWPREADMGGEKPAAVSTPEAPQFFEVTQATAMEVGARE